MKCQYHQLCWDRKINGSPLGSMCEHLVVPICRVHGCADTAGSMDELRTLMVVEGDDPKIYELYLRVSLVWASKDISLTQTNEYWNQLIIRRN